MLFEAVHILLNQCKFADVNDLVTFGPFDVLSDNKLELRIVGG